MSNQTNKAIYFLRLRKSSKLVNVTQDNFKLFTGAVTISHLDLPKNGTKTTSYVKTIRSD